MAKRKTSSVFNSEITTSAEEEKIIHIDSDSVETVVSTKDEVIRLTKENSDLTDKIAKYIEEIQELKSKNAVDLDGKKSKITDEEIQQLKDENQKNILKIAELTLENAALKNEINKLNDLIKISQIPNQNISKNNNNISKHIQYSNITNGYSDWN